MTTLTSMGFPQNSQKVKILSSLHSAVGTHHGATLGYNPTTADVHTQMLILHKGIIRVFY